MCFSGHSTNPILTKYTVWLIGLLKADMFLEEDQLMAPYNNSFSVFRLHFQVCSSIMFWTVMIPLWAFTLGQEIFSSGQMVVPYSRIAESAVGMAVPIAIGVSIQHCWPSLSRLLVRFLKPFSTLLILGIIIFATVTNWYLFRLFTWQVGLLPPKCIILNLSNDI